MRDQVAVEIRLALVVPFLAHRRALECAQGPEYAQAQALVQL